jgi:large conductance mechanosensitive channel
MLKGFRDFILRGNVVDLAVAVIIGGAFGKVVASMTTDIILQFVAAIAHVPKFSELAFNLDGTPIKYGNFLDATIGFLIVAAVIYFFVVLPLNYLMAKMKKPDADPEVTTKTCGQCHSDIPLAATRCKFCTQPVAA